MTEERTIRVSFIDGNETSLLEIPSVGMMWIQKNETEPAPPKNWKPACFEVLSKDNECAGNPLFNNCENCPFRMVKQ